MSHACVGSFGCESHREAGWGRYQVLRTSLHCVSGYPQPLNSSRSRRAGGLLLYLGIPRAFSSRTWNGQHRGPLPGHPGTGPARLLLSLHLSLFFTREATKPQGGCVSCLGSQCTPVYLLCLTPPFKKASAWLLLAAKITLRLKCQKWERAAGLQAGGWLSPRPASPHHHHTLGY